LPRWYPFRHRPSTRMFPGRPDSQPSDNETLVWTSRAAEQSAGPAHRSRSAQETPCNDAVKWKVQDISIEDFIWVVEETQRMVT
jgi:hypothetical protein